jgi:hypothetical protein
MPLVHCPECDASASSLALTCPSCGYPISTTGVRPVNSALHGAGTVCLVLGLLGMVYGLRADTSVGEYNNLGLLAGQIAIVTASGLLAVTGAVLLVAGYAADLRRLMRYTTGVRQAQDEDRARCAKCGRDFPESQLVTHDGTLLCRDDYEALNR